MVENISAPAITNVSFRFPNGRIEAVTLPVSSSRKPSSFLIGMKKGGSTLMDKLWRPLMQFTDKLPFHFSDIIFARGISESTLIEDIDGTFQRPGYVFGVFRWLPNSDVFNLAHWIKVPSRETPKILLFLRDPRDALVSLYYSDTFSHVIPEIGPVRAEMLALRERLKRISLDEYVLEQAPYMLQNLMRSLQLMAVPNLELIRYEDIIYNKALLVKAIARTIGAENVPAEFMQSIATKNDEFPPTERPHYHVRRVHPGDFRLKLKQQTIDHIDAVLRPALLVLDYKSTSMREV